MSQQTHGKNPGKSRGVFLTTPSVHCDSGNWEGQANKFEREGGQVAAQGVAVEELRMESVTEGCFCARANEVEWLSTTRWTNCHCV